MDCLTLLAILIVVGPAYVILAASLIFIGEKINQLIAIFAPPPAAATCQHTSLVKSYLEGVCTMTNTPRDFFANKYTRLFITDW